MVAVEPAEFTIAERLVQMVANGLRRFSLHYAPLRRDAFYLNNSFLSYQQNDLIFPLHPRIVLALTNHT